MTPEQPSQAKPFSRDRIPPELLAWARQTFDEEEFLAQIREMEAGGGQRPEDFIDELEACQ